MSHPLDLREVAPDGKGIATLKYVSEAPFGPPYFQLLVNGTVLGNRVFGGVLLWSNDGNKLFAQEWRNTQNAHTCLLCIDARTMHETVLAEARGGFLYPKAYVRGSLTYVETYYGRKNAGSTERRVLIEPTPEQNAP